MSNVPSKTQSRPCAHQGELRRDFTSGTAVCAYCQMAEIERLQQSLKRYEPVSSYDGRSIESWANEARALRAAAEKVVCFQTEAEYAAAIDELDAALHPETGPSHD